MKNGLIMLNIAVGAIFGLISFLLLLLYSNPNEASFLIIFLFYLSLLLGASGVFTFISFGFRLKRKSNISRLDIIKVSLRQSIFLSSLLVAILVLQKFKFLNWWVGSLLFILILMAEIFFSKKQNS